MAIIPKQDVSFFFGSVNQGKSKRNLRPGDLIEAINVRQIIEDEWRKRPGFDRLVPTPTSGSFTANAESFVSDGKSQLLRDGADVVWSRSGSTLVSRGTAKRAVTTVSPGQTFAGAAQPITVFDGTNYWIFVRGGTGNSYRWEIRDATGGVVKAPAEQSVSNIIAITAACDGTYVWVIYGTSGSTTTRSHRFTIASPSTAPTAAVYQTLTRNAVGVDCHVLASGSIAVVWSSSSASSTDDITVSYLDTATGAAKVSPAAVTTTFSGTGSANYHPSSPSILVADGSNGSWYVTFWSSVSTNYTLYLATITASNLTTALTSLATTSGATVVRAWSVGYRAANGDRVVYATSYTDSGSPVYPLQYVTTRYTYNGSSTTTLVIRNYSYPVSKPQLLGSTYYYLSGYDDGPTSAFLRSYFLNDSDGNIITQISYSLASPAGNTSTGAPALTALSYTTQLLVSGNKLFAGLLVNTGSGGGAAGVNDFAPALVACDFAPSYSAPVRIRDGMVIWPNGVPLVAGTADNQHEAALMLSPPPATFTAGTATLAGPSVVQYLYRITDSDGTIYRSAPSVAQSQTFGTSGPAIIVKPLTHLMPGVTAVIEIYLSSANSTQPILHAVVANDPTVSTISTTPTPGTISSTNPTIYTYGGGLPNFPLPSSLCVANFRNRTIVASGSDLWPSAERESGLGPQWNSAMVTTWDDGEGDMIAMCPIDWNYLAIFKRNAVAVVSGPGPNATAGGGVAGNYEPQTLKVSKGQINARSVLRGPGGCYFQSLADGRIYCATPSLEIADASRGMEAYTSETVVAVNFVEKSRQLHFHCATGSVLVLDYAHPTPEQPFGQWSKWTSSGLAAACGATIDSTGVPVHLEAVSGAIRTPGTGWTDATSGAAAAVLQSVETGDLAAGGGLGASFRVDAVSLHGEWIATNTTKITVSSDFASTVTTHTSASITASPQDVFVRPAGHDRVRSVRVKVEETVSAGEGFIFNGITLTVQPHGRVKFPSNSRRVA